MTKELMMREILMIFLIKLQWGTPKRRDNYIKNYTKFYLEVAEYKNLTIQDLSEMEQRLERRRMSREEAAQIRVTLDASLNLSTSGLLIRSSTSKFWVIVGKIWLAMGGKNGDDSGSGGGGVRG